MRSDCFPICLIRRHRRRLLFRDSLHNNNNKLKLQKNYTTLLHRIIFQTCWFVLPTLTRETESRDFNTFNILLKYTFLTAIFGEPHFATAYFFLFKMRINMTNTLELILMHIRNFYVLYCPCI